MSEERASRMIRSWIIAEKLAGREFDGLRNGELAKALGVTPATITVDLKELEAAVRTLYTASLGFAVFVSVN